MLPLSFRTLVLGALALHGGLSAAAGEEKNAVVPCTAHSPNTGSFYDLRSLALSLPDPDKKGAKGARSDSWHARGWDYSANFTMNICAPVIEDVKDVVGIEKSQWQNVSAFYTQGGHTFSIGQESSNVTFRGRKLVLQYINGSPCGSAQASSDSKDKNDGHRRKSMIISFHCEKEPLAAPAAISFVGTDPDECAYFFEVRSEAACGGAAPVQAGVGPAGVFGIIVMIAVVVYFIGGIMYQRSVAHARGWRQLPNYSLWAGIGSFFQVSLRDLIAGVRGAKRPRVASVRDGILPTMEHRPIARAIHRPYGSRSSVSYYPP